MPMQHWCFSLTYRCALQVIGPHDHMRNTDGLLGRAVSDQALLVSRGYAVIMLRIEPLPHGSNSHLAQLQFLSALLSRHGIAHPISAADAQATTPDEFAPVRPAGADSAGASQRQPRQLSTARASSDRPSPSPYSNGTARYTNGVYSSKAEAHDQMPTRAAVNGSASSQTAGYSLSSAGNGVIQQPVSDASMRRSRPGYSSASTRPRPLRDDDTPPQDASSSGGHSAAASSNGKGSGSTVAGSWWKQQAAAPSDAAVPSRFSQRSGRDSSSAPDRRDRAAGGRSQPAIQEPAGSQNGSTDSWGRVDAAAHDDSITNSSNGSSWGRWDPAASPSQPSTAPSQRSGASSQRGSLSPLSNGSALSSSAPSSSSARSSSKSLPRSALSNGSKGGLRRTRNSLDLKSLPQESDEDRQQRKRSESGESGSWNDW